MRFKPYAALGILLLVTVPLFGGVSYTFQSSTTGIATVALSGSADAAGSKMRVHFFHGDGMMFPDDSVALTTDGGKSLSVVDLKAKTFYLLPIEDLISGLGAAGMMKATGAAAKVTDAGAGPQIEGMPTRHMVVDVSYDLELGPSDKTHVIMHGDVFLTDRVPADTASFIGLKGFHTGIAAVDQVIDAQTRALRGGFPLKEVMNVSAKGGVVDFSTTTTASVGNVKVHDIPASQFVVPAGFKRVESPLEKLKKAL